MELTFVPWTLRLVEPLLTLTLTDELFFLIVSLLSKCSLECSFKVEKDKNRIPHKNKTQ